MSPYRSRDGDSQTIYTPLGEIKTWENNEWGNHRKTSINIEFREETGGLTLSDRKIYYTTGGTPIRWSVDNGFIDEINSVRGDLSIRSSLTKSKQRILTFSDPEVLEISNMLFDLLLTGQLPNIFMEEEYHKRSQKAIQEWYSKFNTIQKLEAEMNEFAKTEGTALHKIANPETTYSHSVFPQYRQTRTR